MKGQTQFTRHIFLLITGIKTKMLLMIFWGLIATLTSVSGNCDVANPQLNDFDWTKVGISVLKCLL